MTRALTGRAPTPTRGRRCVDYRTKDGFRQVDENASRRHPISGETAAASALLHGKPSRCAAESPRWVLYRQAANELD